MDGLFSPELLRQQLIDQQNQQRAQGLFQANQSIAQAPNLAGRLAGLGSAIGQAVTGGLMEPKQTSPAIERATKARDLLQQGDYDLTTASGWKDAAKGLIDQGLVQEGQLALNNALKMQQLEPKAAKPEPVVNVVFPNGDKRAYRKDSPELDAALGKGALQIGLNVNAATTADLEKGTKKDIEVTLGKLDNQLARIQEIKGNFDDKYLTFSERGKQWMQSLYLKAGGALSTEEKQAKIKFETFKSDVLNNLNLYIKEITGAQMSEHEAKRIIKAQPNMGDDAVSFEAKLNNVSKLMEAAVKRSQYALDNGYKHVGGSWTKGGKTLGLEKFMGNEPAASVQPNFKVGQKIKNPTTGEIRVWDGKDWVIE